MEKGTIVNSTNKVECGDYPHIFSPLYRYKDTDILLAEGDIVFRIIFKNWEHIVKSVSLSEYHLNNECELFISLDDVEKELKKRKEEKQKLYKNQNVYSNLENIWLFSNTENLEEKPMVEIKKNLDYIRQASKEALEILKKK